MLHRSLLLDRLLQKKMVCPKDQTLKVPIIIHPNRYICVHLIQVVYKHLSYRFLRIRVDNIKKIHLNSLYVEAMKVKDGKLDEHNILTDMINVKRVIFCVCGLGSVVS